MKWYKTVQTMGSALLPPIPQLSDKPPITEYQQLIAASSTKKPIQPLPTMASVEGLAIVTTELLTNALKDMYGLDIDSSLHSLQTLCREGTTATYHTGVDILDVKRHGNWSSEACCDYSMAHALHTAQSQ